jgi:hypothetical protein
MALQDFIKQSFRELQQKVADKLGNSINCRSLKQKKTGLITFGIVTGTFCLFLIMGVVGSHESAEALKIDSISLPKSIHPIDSVKTFPDKALDSVKAIIRQLYHDHSNN